MTLLAVSGGPDSMFMLSSLRKKNIFVAHVNYHKRSDSDNDELIVIEFCNKYSIPYEVLNVTEKPQGNFQAWARKIRYDFFKKLYVANNCDKLLLGHHKDDFLETAIMQQDSGREPEYFGIKKKNNIDDMNIVRPYLHKYWKHQIERILHDEKTEYATDSSNADPEYTRNKVRIRLAEMALSEKKNVYEWFLLSNKILVKKIRKINNFYKLWKKSEFNTLILSNLNFKPELVYKMINENFVDIKLSSAKIESICDFLNSPNGGKEFKLNEMNSLSKKNGKILFIKKGSK